MRVHTAIECRVRDIRRHTHTHPRIHYIMMTCDECIAWRQLLSGVREVSMHDMRRSILLIYFSAFHFANPI